MFQKLVSWLKSRISARFLRSKWWDLIRGCALVRGGGRRLFNNFSDSVSASFKRRDYLRAVLIRGLEVCFVFRNVYKHNNFASALFGSSQSRLETLFMVSNYLCRNITNAQTMFDNSMQRFTWSTAEYVHRALFVSSLRFLFRGSIFLKRCSILCRLA